MQKTPILGFLLIFFIFQYKNSENSNARIFRKKGTNEQTAERRWIQRSIDSIERPKRYQEHEKYVHLYALHFDEKIILKLEI